MNSKDNNALLTEASAAEAAELLGKLDRGYRSAHAVARQAEGTPEWGSRYSMATDLHQDATLAWIEAGDRGLREPAETIPAMAARAYREALTEPEHEAEASLTMAGDQGKHGPRWYEGYQLGLRDGLTGGMTCVCDGDPETLEMAEGYWAGRKAGLQQREAAPEAGS